MGNQNALGLLMIFAGLVLTPGGVLVLVRGKESGREAFEGQPGVAETPEEKGLEFEKWVVGRFNRSYFKIKDWRGDKRVAGVYVESSKFPDLEVEFRYQNRRTPFAVECKWRRSFDAGSKLGVEWATKTQIANYQDFQRDRSLPVFVVIGIGGEPDNPAELYVTPLDRLKYPFASIEYLAKFRRTRPAANFFFDPEKPGLK